MICSSLLAILLLIPQSSSLPKVNVEVDVTVVDSGGNPVKGAIVSTRWIVEEDGSLLPKSPEQYWESDSRGKVRIKPKTYLAAIFAISPDMKMGGSQGINLFEPVEPVTIKLAPLATVKSDCSVTEWEGEHPTFDWNVQSVTMTPTALFAAVAVEAPAMGPRVLKLPAGRYDFTVSNPDLEKFNKSVTLSPGDEVDLGKINLELTGIAKSFGRTPPPITVTESRLLEKPFNLEDYRGKWVMMYFWGYWCVGCVTESMPALSKFVEENQDKADKFAVISFHDTFAKTFEELDPKLKPIKNKFWGGKDLAFPILMDSTGETFKKWGIKYTPTYVLIDPEGRIVRDGSLEMLNEKLKGLK